MAMIRPERSSTDSAVTEARLRAGEQVFALLSHEIRTPLNGVLGMAGLLASTGLDATQQAYLATLRESGEHLLSLVNDVLDLAKLGSSRLELEPVETDIERLLQGVCELLSPRAYAQGLEIAWVAEASLPIILADDGRLRQILFNLAGNAVKLSAKGGVLLSAETAAPSADGVHQRLRFCVKDTGPGVPTGSESKIFEEFVQTEAGVRAGGVGLGLAIVKRLAEAFQGQVGVTSKPNEGAVFWFEAEFEVARNPRTGAELDGLLVGVVSASAIVREAARRQIEACGGTALAARVLTPSEANTCAAVLVDPDPEHLEPPGFASPALVLLAPESRERIDTFRAAGFAGYLIKPLRRGSLAARVLAVQPNAKDRDEVNDRIVGDDERAGPDIPQGVRVLLAEDNAVNALLARALLIRQGCVVDRVSTGVEALAALQAAPYDAVLMDMRMPEMDGVAATRALRAMGDQTPIIALTANVFESDRRACLDAGMDDFLTKPLDVKALRAALTRWTRGAPRRVINSAIEAPAALRDCETDVRPAERIPIRA